MYSYVSRALGCFLCTLLVLGVISGCATVQQSGPQPAARPSETVAAPPTLQPAITEKRQIVLEWPQRLREKDSDWVLLSLVMDEAGSLTATVETPGHAGEQVPVALPNLYDTHNVVAVARLDLAGMDAWREPVREPMRPGRPVTFRWAIRAEEAGEYRGVLWLSLEFVPLDSTQPVQEMALLSRPFTIDVVTVMGLPGWAGRVAGGAGVVISTVLGFPLVQPAIELLWKRLRGKATRPTKEG